METCFFKVKSALVPRHSAGLSHLCIQFEGQYRGDKRSLELNFQPTGQNSKEKLMKADEW